MPDKPWAQWGGDLTNTSTAIDLSPAIRELRDVDGDPASLVARQYLGLQMV
jgi:hypothetical protein